MEVIRPLSDDDLDLMCVLEDELLFALMFWDEDLSEEMSIEQKALFCDRSKRILVCTGRKIAKTIRIETRVIQFGLLHEKLENSVAEALCFTPHVSQMTPLVNRIFSRIERVPFFNVMKRTMLRGESPYLELETGVGWYFRIEGIKGTDANMVGIRAEEVLGDEMAFGADVPHNSRIQTAMPDARWWYSGVPNGNRTSPFYRLDQAKGSAWSRHKYSTYINPIYQTEQRRAELIEAYGGENTQGYKTQVLGEWGDEFVSTFPPQAIAIGPQPYYVKSLTGNLRQGDTSIAMALGLPSVRASLFCLGWDYGYSPDPSVLLIAYSNEPNEWHCFARVVMRQVDVALQCDVVKFIYEYLLIGSLVGVSSDNHEAIQVLQRNDPLRESLFYRVTPGGSMGMVDEHGAPVFETDENGQPTQVKIRVKQYLTERFRQAMINRNLDLEGIKLSLGNDLEMTEELAGTMERKSDWYTTYHGPPDPENPGRELDHSADSGRWLTDAILKSAAAMARDTEEEALIASMGWAGEAQNWRAAWAAEPASRSSSGRPGPR